MIFKTEKYIGIFLYSFLVLLRATTLVQKFFMINCCRKISVSIKVSYDLISRLSLVTATTPIQIQPFISTAEKWQEWKSEINSNLSKLLKVKSFMAAHKPIRLLFKSLSFDIKIWKIGPNKFYIVVNGQISIKILTFKINQYHGMEAFDTLSDIIE